MDQLNDLFDTAFNAAVLSDHDLLLGGVVDLVEENMLNARRWARVVELHRRNTRRHHHKLKHARAARPDLDWEYAYAS